MQVKETLQSKLALGQSKHIDKALGLTSDKIYSVSTMRTYMKHCNYFTKYCKENYHCKTLNQCRKYVDEFIQLRIDEGKSPYTQKLEASALAKLYGCHTTDFVQTEVRHRANIIRSRGKAKRDKHFSEANHIELVDFCKSTGLRRRELTQLTGEALYKMDGKYYLHVTKGTKGGKERTTLVIGNIENVVNLMTKAGKEKVFKNIPNGANIHGYRSNYANSLYKQIARPRRKIPREDKYICRNDLKGVIYDKRAMAIVSENLGHNRISVIAQSYLRAKK